MAELKLNVQSSDKLKALIGDLGIECEIPVSALVEYVNNNIVITKGITFPSGELQDVLLSDNEPITPDTIIILRINGDSYKIAAQLIS